MNSWSYFKTLMNANQGNFEMNSLEEGKSNFLKMVSSFKSEDDAIVFLNWIKNEALEKLLSNLQLAGMRNRFYSNRTRNLATDDIKTENDDVSISKSFPLETDDKDNSDNFELEPDEIKTFLSHQEPDIYSKKDEEPDTYSEKDEEEADNYSDKYEEGEDAYSEKDEEDPDNNSEKDKEEENSEKDEEKEENSEKDEEDEQKYFTDEFESQQITDERSNQAIFNGEKNSKRKQTQPKNIDLRVQIWGKYKCEECEKTFITPSKLKRHSFTHSGLQPYQCNLCHKSYTQPGNLKIHIKNIHQDNLKKEDLPIIPSKQQPKKSISDPVEFINVKAEQNHKSLPKPRNSFKYKCEYCSKTFITPSKLQRHSYSHTGLRPFQCNICYKAFSQSANLKTHMKKDHPQDLDFLKEPLNDPFKNMKVKGR